MSKQGLYGLTNPFVTCESSFGGYFLVSSDSVFLDSFWVNMGCVGWRIHGSLVKAVLGAVDEWAATHFSLTVYESTGAVWSDESIRHPWKQFRGLFLSGQRLSFPWLFVSQQGFVWDAEFMGHLWKQFWGLFMSGQGLSFPLLFMSRKGLCGLTNPFINCESCLRGSFIVSSDSVFLDYLWVHRGSVGWRIHSSPVKAVSGALSEWAAIQFSLTVYESTGAVWADESIRHLWKQFRGLFMSGQRLSFPWLFMSQCVTLGRCFSDDFLVATDSVFIHFFWVKRGYRLFWIHTSPLDVVSVMISESAST